MRHLPLLSPSPLYEMGLCMSTGLDSSVVVLSEVCDV